MAWKIIYIEQVEKWLDKLDKTQLKSLVKELRMLERCGNKLKLPHTKSLGAGLFELRERQFGLRAYYTYKDDNIGLAGTYSYRLKQVDTDGTFEYSLVAMVDIATPLNYELKQNYPNPFNPSTFIKFYIPVSSNVKLNLFNMLGQKVAELINAEITAGIHEVELNVESAAGGLSSGTYFYFLEADGHDGNQFSDMKKMVLLK